MARDAEHVEVDYDAIKLDDERCASILFVFGKREVWLPRSQVEVDSDAECVLVPEWLAVKEGLV